MRTVTYIGPLEGGVEIADTGQLAEPGEPVEVSNELADSLLQQVDVWAIHGDEDEQGGGFVVAPDDEETF